MQMLSKLRPSCQSSFATRFAYNYGKESKQFLVLLESGLRKSLK